MCRRSRTGFTLVELLVVITVIGILMAIIIPAASGFIEVARRTNCLNNMHEIGQACRTYESAKSFFPPERTNLSLSLSNNGQNVTISWAGLLLPNLGKGDGQVSYMPVYVCPSNAPDSINDSAPPLAYACNAGRKNKAGSGTVPSDWKTNGVFIEQMKGVLAEKVTSDYINGKDGLDRTFLVMEMLPPPGKSWVDASDSSELWNGMVWPHSYKGSQTDDTRVNDPYVKLNFSQGTGITQSTMASRHPGGASVVFCDGHTLFVGENIDPAIIEYEMTPDGAHAKAPGSNTVSGQLNKPVVAKSSFTDVDLQ